MSLVVRSICFNIPRVLAFADAVLTVAKGKLMADKLLASGGMTKDKSVRTPVTCHPCCIFFLLMNTDMSRCDSRRLRLERGQ